MFFFHEGLPRSGKSYEACKEHIVPALKSGRKVFAYIEGLNFDKFAEVCELPVANVQQLLILVPADRVKQIHRIVENDSLVVLDEMQDFWPSGKEKLSPDLTTFITQHGHRGLDILGLGQCMKDINILWRRRCQRKIVFTKRTAVGRDDTYLWEAYEAQRPDVFQKISSGVKKYDPAYFGLYASHVDGTQNKGNYLDDRVNIFRTKSFRFFVPAYLAVFGFAIWWLIGYFSPGSSVSASASGVKDYHSYTEPVSIPVSALPSTAPDPVVSESLGSGPVPVEVVESSVDYFDSVARASLNRVRLSGLIQGQRGIEGYVDILDMSYHLKERFTVSELRSMGWRLDVTDHGLELRKDGVFYLARTWPLDLWGRVAQSKNEGLKSHE